VLLIFGLLLVATILMRLGTLAVPPTWDPAMSVWPAAIEMAERGSIFEVVSLPTYIDGGPNTHTLSLITLLTAGLIEGFGVQHAIGTLHWVNIVLLATIGLMVTLVGARYVSRIVAVLLGVSTVVFPLMVAQSAYLYTELASSACVMGALLLGAKRRVLWATLVLTIGVAIKPLAVVAIPALLVFAWRSGASMRTRLAPLLAAIGMIPALLVPTETQVLTDRWEWASLIWSRTALFATEAPEVLVMLAVTVVTGLRIQRKPEEGDLEWFWPICALVVSFIAFFAITPLVTVGHVMLPRYTAMLVGPVMILLAILIRSVAFTGQLGIVSILIVAGILGATGPFAWGSGSRIPPVAERSLAFVELFEDHRAGMTRMAEMSREGTPIFVDHYGGFGFMYPGLGHFEGDVRDWTVVRSFGLDPTDWGENLDELPDRFAMLAGAPMLGSDRFWLVREMAKDDDRYRVSDEAIGSASTYPIQVITVERVLSDGG
jgi:hypothetical protein